MKNIIIFTTLGLLIVGCLPVFFEDTNPILYDIEWSPITDDIIVSGYNLELYSDNLEQVITLNSRQSNSQVVALHPDADLLAQAYCKLELWNIEERTLANTFDNGQCISSLAWSPDGTHLAIGETDNTITVFESDTFANANTLKGHTEDISSIVWDSSGEYLMSSSHDGSVIKWSVDSRESVWAIELSEPVYSLAISPDDVWIAIAGRNTVVEIRNVNTSQLHSSFIVDIDSVSVGNVKWNPNNTQIAIVAHDSIQIWDFDTLELVLQVSTNNANVDSFAWNSDGTMFASASRDNLLRVWDTQTGDIIYEIQLPHQ